MSKEIEIIERKGIGHPDTIADNLSEELSYYLEKTYKDIYGKIMHYNVDKTLVSCGKIDYNKKKMIKPVKIVFSGNATKLPKKIMKQLLETVVKSVLEDEINRGLKYKIYNFIAECSPDLTNNYKSKKSNDTSFSVGHPLTENEKLVLEIGGFLDRLHKVDNGLNKFGTDNKVMFINGEIYIALAFITKTTEEYYEAKKYIKKELESRFKRHFIINAADKKDMIFNTVTGTSLEQGDAGMTGRGNRYNGLITPLKPMTMEAYAGKNNQTHIGKIYQKWSQEIAEKTKQNILLVNKIGGNIKKPISFRWKN